MLRRAIQLLTLAALVNLIYQLWPRSEDDELFLARDAVGKWGYVDSAGRVRIDFVWDDISYRGIYSVIDSPDLHTDGLGLVRREKRFGIINRKGEEVIKPEWEVIFWQADFSYAQVVRDQKVGIIDRDGRFVVEQEWDQISLFDEDGYATVREKSLWGLVNREGHLLVEPKWTTDAETGYGPKFGPQGIAPAIMDDEWKLVNRAGETVSELDFDFEVAWVGHFARNGLALIYDKPGIGSADEEISRGGWINTKGEMVIPRVWINAMHFDDEGMAPAEKDGLWGWIDETGEFVIQPEWDSAEQFHSNGLAWVKKDNLWGLINRAGEVVVPPTWHESRIFEDDGTARVVAPRGTGRISGWGLISTTGEVLVEPKWDALHPYDDKGFARVEQGHRNGMIDREGNVRFLLEDSFPAFDRNDRALFQPTTEQVRLIRKPPTGWIDRNGELVINIPKGWNLDKRAATEGAYMVYRSEELTGTNKWIAMVRNWWRGDDTSGDTQLRYRAFDKDGTIIYDSAHLRPKAKAWLFFIATLLPLALVLLLGRRQRRVPTERLSRESS